MPVWLSDGRNWIVCITDLWSKAVRGVKKKKV